MCIFTGVCIVNMTNALAFVRNYPSYHAIKIDSVMAGHLGPSHAFIFQIAFPKCTEFEPYLDMFEGRANGLGDVDPGLRLPDPLPVPLVTLLLELTLDQLVPPGGTIATGPSADVHLGIGSGADICTRRSLSFGSPVSKR